MIAPLLGRTPVIPASAFVAPTALVVGDVVFGDESSLWYGAVARGDVGPIRIGARTNVQDLCVLHTTNGRPGLFLGEEVTVGHRVILHGATVRDRCLIGMGSILLDDCEIGEESLVAAGSVVLEGTKARQPEPFGVEAQDLLEVISGPCEAQRCFDLHHRF